MAVQLFTILGNHIYIYTYTFTHTYVYTQHGHHQNGNKKEKYTFENTLKLFFKFVMHGDEWVCRAFMSGFKHFNTVDMQNFVSIFCLHCTFNAPLPTRKVLLHKISAKWPI